MVNSIFDYGKHKEGKGKRIPNWMLTEEMKLMMHYQIMWRRYTYFGLNLGRNKTRLQLYSKTLKNWHTDCGDGISNQLFIDDVKVINSEKPEEDSAG
ncbi:hypothetical protein Tco_1510163 [Tanacetum coccineum]